MICSELINTMFCALVAIFVFFFSYYTIILSFFTTLSSFGSGDRRREFRSGMGKWQRTGVRFHSDFNLDNNHEHQKQQHQYLINPFFWKDEA
ncbi:hypothetical protein L2E82_12423 [Cichorium intybus]|uniref:Uncharacterized protein n=1 Tax=Cichorium intybus TaxID=13427 RepID=A0ACB9GFV6_CICIN|nr:hypothetical protein L2E82_12423 [Cichorium intybus]